MLVSAVFSFATGKWHWFGRSGAVGTIAGAILTVRPLVRMGLEEWVRDLSTIDGGHIIPTPEEVEANRQAKTDARAVSCGAILAVFGTLVWAYGDLIGAAP